MMSTFQPMSESEFQIMEIIWKNNEPMTSAQIIDSLDETKNWKPSTVWTFLGRLVEKGFLSAQKIGKRSLYSPTVSHEEYLQMQTEDFLKTVHGGSVKSFFAALSGGTDLTPDEFSELKKWLSDQTEETL